MKYSIYNSILPLTKKSSMIFNASSDKFLVFKKELEALLKQDPQEMQRLNPVFYDQLRENGFIADNETDEVAEMIALGLEYCNNKSNYHLVINPTTNCNFRCWYCYEQHSPHAKMKPEMVENVKNMIARIAKKEQITSIDLSFFGGEPLLYYRDTVEPIIDAMREEHDRNENLSYGIHFTTNGFLINDYIINHLTQKDDEKTFQITLDGGREQHNKVRFSASGNGSYDRIVGNIKKLLSKKMHVGLRINYTKDNISSVKGILDDLNDISCEDEKYLSVDFQRVWQETNLDNNAGVLSEAIDAFRKRFPRVYGHYNHTDAFRNPCYADLKNECVVNYDGNVYKCTARDFTPENSLGSLNSDGNITWNSPDFVENRVCKKFNKEICNKCRIFPICGGGCAQNALEYKGDTCPKYSSELEKDEIILMRFYNNVVRTTINKNL